MQDNFSASRKDYRAIYKEFYDIEFDSSFVIHHIDFDRTNNDIENLILLPRGLHSKYHQVIREIQGTPKSENPLIDLKITTDMFYRRFAYRDLAEVVSKIGDWVCFRNLRYKMPDGYKMKLAEGRWFVCQ